MTTLCRWFIVFMILVVPSTGGFAQDSTVVKEKIPVRSLVVSYNIDVKTHKASGLAETYNGGTKTIFVDDNKVRIRMVSLMRIQSIFFDLLPAEAAKTAAVVKESGKEKYKVYLSSNQWNWYNKAYDSSTCTLFADDSINLLGYNCKKAIVQRADGEQLTVYYTDEISNKTLEAAEPSFSCVPGLVLKYEYTNRKNSITYTASGISFDPISADVFKVPSKGFAVRKFNYKASDPSRETPPDTDIMTE